MKIMWRKKEFKEFICLEKWAFSRRRVGEIPAYLHPIGFGFSIVKPIRQGFWLGESIDEIYVGFLESSSNFHYFCSNGGHRSSAAWPEPALTKLSFEEGVILYKSAIVKDTKDRCLPNCRACITAAMMEGK